MKTIETIKTIIAEMPDTLFDKINDAEYDAWDLDRRVARNGKKRLAYNLQKVGLTVEEWYAWCDD
jgi:hypothetical protein